MTTHISCVAILVFFYYKKSFKYNNKWIWYSIADLWNIQKYFPGVQRHAGTLAKYPFPGGGDNFALLLPLKVKIPAPPRLGGGVYIDWCIRLATLLQKHSHTLLRSLQTTTKTATFWKKTRYKTPWIFFLNLLKLFRVGKRLKVFKFLG
jgi:hypothetical protein